VAEEGFNRQKAENEIRDEFQCPEDWGRVFRVESPALFEPLEILWRTILIENVRGDEAFYAGPDFLLSLLSNESDSELRAIQANISLWKETCRDLFRSKIRRFTELRYASRQVYEKHLPPPGPPRDRAWIENVPPILRQPNRPAANRAMSIDGGRPATRSATILPFIGAAVIPTWPWPKA